MFIAHGSVNSYVPELSVNDIPTDAYIMQSPDGLDTKHDSAVPTEIVPLGHVVAIVMAGSSIAMYPDGHDVDGATANTANGIKVNKINNIFIYATLVGY